MFEEENFSLSPIHFFQLSVDCVYAQPASPFPRLGSKHLLPDTTALCHEEAFAEVFLGWNAEGIAAQVQVSQPFQRVNYPEVTRGDSVELFLIRAMSRHLVLIRAFVITFSFCQKRLKGIWQEN